MTNQNELQQFSQKIQNQEIAPASKDTIVSGGAVVDTIKSAVSITPVTTPAESKSESKPEDEEYLDDMFDGVTLAGIDKESVKNADETQVGTEDETVEERWRHMISQSMSDMAQRDPGEFDAQTRHMIGELLAYRKDLMIKNGFTAAEADAAADKRLRRTASQANAKYLEENPNLAVVTIDKSKSDTVTFSDEEKAKMVKAKAIRLVEVEDTALSTLQIKPADTDEDLYKAIHRVSCNVSKYEMPMINTCDTCEFTGATTYQLLQAVYDANDSLYRKTQAQLDLIYTKFEGSATRDKYGPDGQVIFTKEDFAKWFKFHDIPVGLYSIYVASSTEEITSQFTCSDQDGGCGKTYKQTYNCKKLINYDDIPEKFKADLDNILAYGADRESLSKYKEEHRKSKRFKSPFTNNIYDISSPSVARALQIFRYINPRDAYANLLASYAIMFENIYVYDPTDGQYFQIKSEDAVNIMRFMYDMTDMEFRLITKEADEYFYTPKFRLETKCTECGKVRDDEFDITELVFLKAQDMAAEIV